MSEKQEKSLSNDGNSPKSDQSNFSEEDIVLPDQEEFSFDEISPNYQTNVSRPEKNSATGIQNEIFPSNLVYTALEWTDLQDSRKHVPEPPVSRDLIKQTSSDMEQNVGKELLKLSINFDESMRGRRVLLETPESSPENKSSISSSENSSYDKEVNNSLSQLEVSNLISKPEALKTNIEYKLLENTNSSNSSREESADSSLEYVASTNVGLKDKSLCSNVEQGALSSTVSGVVSKNLIPRPRNVIPEPESVALPPVPAVSEFSKCIKEYFPEILNRSAPLRDIYKIAEVPDMILLKLYRHNVEKAWERHRHTYVPHQMIDLLFTTLTESVTYLIEENRIQGIDLIYETTGTQRRPHGATLDDMINLELAGLILGYVFLAFAQHTEKDLRKKLEKYKYDTSEYGDSPNKEKEGIRKKKISNCKFDIDKITSFIDDLSKTIEKVSQFVNVPGKENKSSSK